MACECERSDHIWSKRSLWLPYASLPLWTNRAVPNESSETGMPVFRPFHILAAGIVLVIVRLIISSITQECAWETRKKALFWQLSTPGARSQASLQADSLLLRLQNLTPRFSCIYLALSTKKINFFPDLTLWLFNLYISLKYSSNNYVLLCKRLSKPQQHKYVHTSSANKTFYTLKCITEDL